MPRPGQPWTTEMFWTAVLLALEYRLAALRASEELDAVIAAQL